MASDDSSTENQENSKDQRSDDSHRPPQRVRKRLALALVCLVEQSSKCEWKINAKHYKYSLLAWPAPHTMAAERRMAAWEEKMGLTEHDPEINDGQWNSSTWKEDLNTHWSWPNDSRVGIEMASTRSVNVSQRQIAKQAYKVKTTRESQMSNRQTKCIFHKLSTHKLYQWEDESQTIYHTSEQKGNTHTPCKRWPANTEASVGMSTFWLRKGAGYWVRALRWKWEMKNRIFCLQEKNDKKMKKYLVPSGLMKCGEKSRSVELVPE